MTALSIVQTAAAWLALPVPTVVFASTDPQIIQLRSLLNEELTELRTWPDTWWRKLIRQHSFTATATEVQPADAIPDDLGYIITDTTWDRTSTRPVLGPVTPQAWQAWEARPILTSVIFGFRLRGNDYLTAPVPPAGDQIYYEYISKWAVYPGTAPDPEPTQEYFEADDDTTIFDETLMSRGVRWRFLQAKGLAYQQDYALWINMLQRLSARDKSMPRLNAAGSDWTGISGPYVPSFNFPS